MNSFRMRLYLIVSILLTLSLFIISVSLDKKNEQPELRNQEPLVVEVQKPVENWPAVPNIEPYIPTVEHSLNEYRKQRRDYRIGVQNYDPFGDYLNYGIVKNYPESETLKFDEQHIPKLLYNNEFHYNPGTVAQYALTMHGQYLKGKRGPTDFLVTADKLLTLQDEGGGFPYPFSFYYYLMKADYQPGWKSAMDSGMALSVFARAYDLTSNQKYIEAANREMKFLTTSNEDGGVMFTLEDLDPSLKHYIIFEEYPVKPASYTLNGFIFTILGLYDWSHVKSETQQDAKHYFDEGIKTLEKILPYFDIGGFTAYDLGHITYKTNRPHIGIGYHAVHIYQLNVMHDITGNEKFLEYYLLWSSYVDKN